MGDDDLQGISRRMLMWLLDLISFLTDTALVLVQVLVQGLQYMFFILPHGFEPTNYSGVLLAIQCFLCLKCVQFETFPRVPPLFAVVGVKGVLACKREEDTWIAVDIPSFTFTFTALMILVWCKLDLDH